MLSFYLKTISWNANVPPQHIRPSKVICLADIMEKKFANADKFKNVYIAAYQVEGHNPMNVARIIKQNAAEAKSRQNCSARICPGYNVNKVENNYMEWNQSKLGNLVNGNAISFTANSLTAMSVQVLQQTSMYQTRKFAAAIFTKYGNTSKKICNGFTNSACNTPESVNHCDKPGHNLILKKKEDFDTASMQIAKFVQDHKPKNKQDMKHAIKEIKDKDGHSVFKNLMLDWQACTCGRYTLRGHNELENALISMSYLFNDAERSHLSHIFYGN